MPSLGTKYSLERPLDGGAAEELPGGGAPRDDLVAMVEECREGRRGTGMRTRTDSEDRGGGKGRGGGGEEWKGRREMGLLARWWKRKENGNTKAGREWVVGEEKEQASLPLLLGVGIVRKTGTPSGKSPTWTSGQRSLSGAW